MEQLEFIIVSSARLVVIETLRSNDATVTRSCEINEIIHFELRL